MSVLMIDQIESAVNQICRAARTRSLYPVGHPSHANALAVARNVLDALFSSLEQVNLDVSSHGLSFDNELLPDPEGMLGKLASALWDQHICSVAIHRGLNEKEIRLLLELFDASADVREIDLVDRLEKLASDRLTVTHFDYERLVPQALSEDAPVRTIATEDGVDLLRLVASSSDGEELELDTYETPLDMLDDPETLAAAVLSGVALKASGAVVGLGDGDGSKASTQGDVPLITGGHRIERPHIAGAAVALSVQRIAEMGCGAHPEDQATVFTRLAAALRHLDPRLLAHVFRADVVRQDAPFDALQESAAYLSAEELLNIVRAHPQAVTSEAPEVYRRLLERIAPSGGRLAELTPVLKRGLLEDGMSEAVFNSTLGKALAEAAARRAQEGDAPSSSDVAAPRVTRTSEALRAARRDEIEPVLRRTVEADNWTSRASLCAELLQLPGCCERHGNILPTLRESLRRAPEQARREVSARIVEVLTAIAGPSAALRAESRDAAISVLAEVSDKSTLDRLRRSLLEAYGDEAARVVRSLARAGDAGRQALLDALLSADPVEARHIPAIVSALVDVEAEEIASDTWISQVALDPACRHSQPIIAALVDKGGAVAARHLIALLRDGHKSVRSDVVRLAGQHDGSLLSVLTVALDDRDEEIRCAAVAGLGASGDERACPVLLRQLRPFSPRDPELQLRIAAASALGGIKSQRAVDPLAKVARRASWFRKSDCDKLRAAAVRALLEIGTEPALRAAARHANGERCEEIREAAGVAAKRLKQARLANSER